MNKELFMKLGIVGFIGSTVANIIAFFIPILDYFEIIIYDIFILSFGALIAIAFYLLSEKFSRNGIKISSICIINTIMLSVISELVYHGLNPLYYSLEYYNVISFVYGLSTINFFLYLINGIGLGFSILSLGREFSDKILQITAILWVIDIIVSMFLQIVPYLIVFRWCVYIITSVCIWIMIKIKLSDKKKIKPDVEVQIGFRRR
ncbi:MAG: hypothetical protein ACTSPY_02415 [Candidatus Helarchaeota archaeon]